MSRTYQQKNDFVQPKSTATTFLQNRTQLYLLPLRIRLIERLDKRLVTTFEELFRAILLFRNAKMGLLLSELGGYVAGFAHAPAGTKRISNLLRSPNWQADLIDTVFFERAQQRVSQLLQSKIRPLCLWDDSRLEKPEIGPPKRLVCGRIVSGGKQQSKPADQDQEGLL